MKKQQLIFIYIIIFFIISFILKLFGIVDFSTGEIFGYGFIFYGLTLVYTSFGKNKPGALFFGTTLFLSGVFLFILNNFQLANYLRIIISAAILVIGINFFVLFIDNSARKIFLVISLLFFTAGIFFTVSWGSLSFKSFLDSAVYIASKYWPVLIIVAGIVLIIRREEA